MRLKSIYAKFYERVLPLLLISLLVAPPLWLSAEEEPALPSGLGLEEDSSEPELPTGLGTSETVAKKRTSKTSDGDTESSLSLPYSGFFEARGGVRYRNDPYQKRASIGESRLHLTTDIEQEIASFRFTGDFLTDAVANDWPVNLEQGSGFFDLREGYALFRFGDVADVKAGRQILTWGTGDFIFINDLFPKDWNSFFSGRDDEYLKAPSDSIKLSGFSDIVNVDFVYSPSFDSDRYIDGERFSFYSPASGSLVGGDGALNTDRRSSYFSEDEMFARLYRDIGSYEVALYGYHGYFPSPAGFNPATGEATFPRMSSYGASARGPLGDGIVSAEFGHYISQDDRSGSNPLIDNSQLRYLVGYEQELATNLTGGLQYYVEQTLDYGAYRASLPASTRAIDDEFRQVVTARLTRLLMNQNLRLSLFTFYSPTDQDMYLRSHANYKITDRLQTELGTNFFLGEHNYTFFGMFEEASNVYLALRYSFVSE